MSKESEFLTCQRVLSITVFLGFMVHYMLRVNISIAIVAMVSKNDTGQNTTTGPVYNWTEEEKNNVLGCFFVGYFLTQIPGGRLSEIFGSKIVIGTGLLLTSVLTLLTPIACHFNYYWLLATRFTLGVTMGVHWPSIPPIATRWISPNDTAKFMSHMVASSLGAAVTLSTGGYLIAHWGWPSVFYVTGTISLVWTMSWFYLVYDSPEQHPRISREEKAKLRNELKCVINTKEKKGVPWKNIFTSAPVWAYVIADTLSTFPFFIVLTQLPTYFSQVFNFDIKQNGWFSSSPYLIRYLATIVSAWVADKLLQRNTFSRTTIRKIFVTIIFSGTCLLFTIQAFFGYNSLLSVIVFNGCLAFLGLNTAGIWVNSVDLAPKYSGTIFGISQVPVSISGYVGTKIVALITKEEQGFQQWSYIFWLIAGSSLFGLIVFLIFGSGEEQNWHPESRNVEMETLQNAK